MGQIGWWMMDGAISSFLFLLQVLVHRAKLLMPGAKQRATKVKQVDELDKASLQLSLIGI